MSDTQTKPRRWLRVLLVASLALNLLIIGLAVGAMLRFGGHEKKKGPRPVAATLYRALPDADRDAIRVRTRELYDSRKGRRSSDLDALIASLAAEPFDAEAMKSLIRAQHADRDAHSLAVRMVWADHVAQMDAPERQAYVRALQERAEKWREHKLRD